MGDGVWRTVGGRRIFIKNGQSLSEAMKNSGKFNSIFKKADGNDIEVMQSVSDEVYNNLSDDEKTALSSYVLEGHVRINQYLKGEFTPTSLTMENEFNNIVNNIDGAMSKYKLNENLIVYRGASMLQYDKYNIGDVFQEKSYTSTSLMEGVARFFSTDAMVEIKVPAKSTGLYIGKNTIYEHEHEFLISRNTKYQVVNKTSDRITLEVKNNDE